MRKRELKGILLVLVVFNVILAAFFARITIPNLHQYISYQGPTFKLLSSVAYKVRDVIDLAYLPFAYGKSSLTTYSIEISPSDIMRLENALGMVEEDRVLTDELRIKVPAKFIYNKEEYDIEISYRGAQDIHWNADKKSYSVRFKKDRPFKNIEKMALILPIDRKYVVEHLNNYRAKKLGFFVPESEFVNVVINNKSQGVYFQQESWSDGFLEGHGKSLNGALYKTKDIRADFCTDRLKYYNCIRQYSSLWEQVAGTEPDGLNTYSHLKSLFDVFSIEDTKLFAREVVKVIDVEQWLKWNVHYLLNQSYHQGLSNLRFYYNPETKKMEVIPWDVGMDMNQNHENIPSTREQIDIPYNGFVDRLLSVDEIRHLRNELLWSYVKSNYELDDDLSFYDNTYESIKDDFYRDLLKRKTSASINKEVERFRNNIVSYYNNLNAIFSTGKYVVEFENKGSVLQVDIITDSFVTLVLDDLEFTLDREIGSTTLYRDSNNNGVFDILDESLAGEIKKGSVVAYVNLNQNLFVPFDYKKGEVNTLPRYRYFLVSDSITDLIDLEVVVRNFHTGKKVNRVGLE